MKHLTHNERPNEERDTIWDAICDQAAKFMTFDDWTIFGLMPWVETGDRSLLQAYAENDLDTMRTILDAVTAEAEHYASTPEDERQPVFAV